MDSRIGAFPCKLPLIPFSIPFLLHSGFSTRTGTEGTLFCVSWGTSRSLQAEFLPLLLSSLPEGAADPEHLPLQPNPTHGGHGGQVVPTAAKPERRNRLKTSIVKKCQYLHSPSEVVLFPTFSQKCLLECFEKPRT